MVEKKNVLWVSRHEMLPVQMKFLAEKLKHFTVEFFRDTVPSAEWLVENVILPKKIDIVIPVLPLSMIARLVELSKKHGFEVWWAQMELLHNDYEEAPPCPDFNSDTDTMVPGLDSNDNRIWRHYRFKAFYRVKEVKLVLEEV